MAAIHYYSFYEIINLQKTEHFSLKIKTLKLFYNSNKIKACITEFKILRQQFELFTEVWNALELDTAWEPTSVNFMRIFDQ